MHRDAPNSIRFRGFYFFDLTIAHQAPKRRNNPTQSPLLSRLFTGIDIEHYLSMFRARLCPDKTIRRSDLCAPIFNGNCDRKALPGELYDDIVIVDLG